MNASTLSLTPETQAITTSVGTGETDKTAQPWTENVTTDRLEEFRRVGRLYPVHAAELIEQNLGYLMKWVRSSALATCDDFRDRDLATAADYEARLRAILAGIAESQEVQA